jgi:hypothetical protein
MLLACRAGHQIIEVHVPAGSGCAIRQTTMDHGEQHLIALWVQLEGNIASTSPGDCELARRIELGDPGLHSMLVGEAGGRWPGGLVSSSFRQTSSTGAPTFS